MDSLLNNKIIKKRYIILIAFLLICFLLLCVRIGYIVFGRSETVSSAHSEKISYYGSGRGQIYDCNMNSLVEKTLRKSDVQLMGEKIGTVNYFDRYEDEQTLCHIIGYLNPENTVGISGLEKDYDDILGCNNFVKFKYYTDALGRLLNKTETDYSSYNNKSGIKLTIDKGIQSISEKSGKSLGKGAVVVMDLKGEIKALSSFPTYNPNNLTEAVENSEEPLFNRALGNYAVGSVFKILVCAAALESGVSETYTHYCNGYEYCGGVRFNCHKEDGHGEVDMRTALAQSCNTYFINLAKEVGANKILALAKNFMIDESMTLSDSIYASAGTLPDMSVLSSSAGLANFSFGQGELTSSPLKMCSIYCTVANGGILYSPKLVTAKVSKSGKEKLINSNNDYKRVLKESTCEKLREFLTFVVSDGTGMTANSEIVSAAGKTATAQTGVFKSDGSEKLNSWFIGFVPANKPEYVIAVMKEDGTSGSGDCAPVFRDIAEFIYA